MENLPTKGNTRVRRNIVIYIFRDVYTHTHTHTYIRNIYGFLDAVRRGGDDIPEKKFTRTKRGLAGGYEVFASASCIVSDNETISPS